MTDAAVKDVIQTAFDAVNTAAKTLYSPPVTDGAVDGASLAQVVRCLRSASGTDQQKREFAAEFRRCLLIGWGFKPGMPEWETMFGLPDDLKLSA